MRETSTGFNRPDGFGWEWSNRANEWVRCKVTELPMLRCVDYSKQPLTAAGTVAATVKGWESDYYKLPPNAKELEDLIEYRKMNFNEGNIFKAIWRLGRKEGTPPEYDLYKIIHFAMRELKRLGKPLPPPHPALHGDEHKDT